MRLLLGVSLLVGVVAACGDDHAGPFWLDDAHVMIKGIGLAEDNCRDNICPHNENTDLINFGGAIYLVHRTAESQILGPNCALRVYKTTDGGANWNMLAILPGPTADTYPQYGDRDLRDPSFDIVDGKLAMKALIRLPVTSSRDSNVDTITVGTISSDGGTTWSPWTPLTTPQTGDGWSFWRIRDYQDVHYAAAYQDGDKSVVLYSSPDGKTWTPGATIYDKAEDTPLETEIVFMPSGRMLALVRVDGTDAELLGAQGRLRTIVCWAQPPYDHFDCPQVLDGQRLDGPVAFFHGSRLWVIARKHYLEAANRKRTSLFEITGTLEGGPIGIREIGEIPSAGDTAYAGAADVDADHVLITWYSSSLSADEPWARAILEASDIWQAQLDMTHVPPPLE
ncbi:MAG TPA: sialidase family protein [Kofleriaceae bacterium]|nr:sialidase family protein [Kofleriaceae bacterium]